MRQACVRSGTKPDPGIRIPAGLPDRYYPADPNLASAVYRGLRLPGRAASFSGLDHRKSSAAAGIPRPCHVARGAMPGLSNARVSGRPELSSKK